MAAKKKTVRRPKTRTGVFVSYSHADREWVDRLRVHLKPRERLGVIETWDDARIRAGQDWRAEIRRALSAARVAVLLVSADFLASDFVTNDELPAILNAEESEGLVVIPVLLEPCAFERIPSLSRFQSVNPPSQPLSALDKPQRAAIWEKLADEIVAVMQGGAAMVPVAAVHVDPLAGIDWQRLAQRWKLANEKGKDSEFHDELRTVAVTLAGDYDIGSTIAQAFREVGEHGAIVVEQGMSVSTELEQRIGFRFDKGYLSPYFVTDLDRHLTILQRPQVLVIPDTQTQGIRSGGLFAAQALVPIVNRAAKDGSALLVIAERLDSDAMQMLVDLKTSDRLACCVVPAPGFGDRRTQLLEDIAIVTGGVAYDGTPDRMVVPGRAMLSPRAGDILLPSADIGSLGAAACVMVTAETTTIIGGDGSPHRIEARRQQIRAAFEQTTSEYDREKLMERHAKLKGVAIVRVGAPSVSTFEPRTKRAQYVVDSLQAWFWNQAIPGPPPA